MKASVKKYSLTIAITFILIVGVVFTGILSTNSQATVKVKVDPSLQYQSFEGFGTSLSWFANVIGGWSDPVRTELVDLLFDPHKGIGINVLRYNIGGGDHPDQTWLRTGADVPGYQPEEGVWDWTADVNQRWVLTAAKQRLGDDLIVEAYANSPPYWMTVSNTSSGHVDGEENLKPEYFDAFANYLTEVVKYFDENEGITFRTLAPFNEPYHTWWQAYNNQEGATFTVASQIDLIDRIDALLQENELSTRISAMNNTDFSSTLYEWKQYDEVTVSKVMQMNTHGYYGSVGQMRQLSSEAAARGKRFWVAEADGGGGSDSFGAAPNGFEPEGMTPSLNLTAMINQQLKEAQPSAWVFWQAIENWVGNLTGQHNWGLISANFEGEGVNGLNKEAYLITKKYYTYGQYAKFIRPGYRQIEINHPDAVAFVSPDEQRLVIVQTNRMAHGETFDYDLSKFSLNDSYAKVYRTSESENLDQLPHISLTKSSLSMFIPEASVTTIVIDQVNMANKLPVFSEQSHYKIENRKSGKTLTISGADKHEEGALIVQFDDVGEASQRWQFIDLGRGYYQIASAHSGQYLDIDGASIRDAASSVQRHNDYGANQQWQLVELNNGYYHIINRNSGKFLDIDGASMNDGAQSIQWSINAELSQQWRVVEMSF